VDAKGGLRGSQGFLPQKLVTSALDEESARARKEKTDHAPQKPGRPAPPMPPPFPIPWAQPAPRLPAWRETLRTLALNAPAALPAAASTNEILYVLDIPATIRSQQLTLEVRTARRKLDGSWGKLSLSYVSRDKIPELPDPMDRKILPTGSGRSVPSSPAGSSPATPSRRRSSISRRPSATSPTPSSRPTAA